MRPVLQIAGIARKWDRRAGREPARLHLNKEAEFYAADNPRIEKSLCLTY